MSTNGATATAHFEPSRYLTKIGSADYLEVKWRLVWLRHEHPDATIETELIEHTERSALFRARIAIPGGGVATGYGSETPGDFRDYIEKAETKAIGRALAALGFGTQFCPDFEFGATSGRVVDSPVDISRTRGWANNRGNQDPGQESEAESARRRVQATEQPATERQLQFLQSVARAAGFDEKGLRAEIRSMTGGERLDLTRREASQLIDRLKAMSTDLPVGDGSTATFDDTMPSAAERMTYAQNKTLHGHATRLFGDDGHDFLHRLAVTDYAVESVSELSTMQASKLINTLAKERSGDSIREYLARDRGQQQMPMQAVAGGDEAGADRWTY